MWKQSRLRERAETQNHCNSAKFHLERLFHQTSQRNPLGFQNSTDRLLIKHALALTSLFGPLTTLCATCYVLSDINRIRGCECRIPLCRKPQLCFLLRPCLLGCMREEIMLVFLYHSSERLMTHALNKILLALIKPARREILGEWTFPAAAWRSATLSFVDSHKCMGGAGTCGERGRCAHRWQEKHLDLVGAVAQGLVL